MANIIYYSEKAPLSMNIINALDNLSHFIFHLKIFRNFLHFLYLIRSFYPSSAKVELIMMFVYCYSGILFLNGFPQISITQVNENFQVLITY